MRMKEITVSELTRLFHEHSYPQVMLLDPEDFFQIIHITDRRDYITTDRFMFCGGEVRPRYSETRPAMCDLTKVPEGESIGPGHSAYDYKS